MGKNIGDQIKDAIQDAISTQDFSSMKAIVEQSIDAATASISAGIEQAQKKAAASRSEHIQRQNEYFEQVNKQRQEMLAIQNRYAPTSGLRASGYAMAIGGGILAGSFGIMALLALIGAATFAPGFNAGVIVLAALCAASIVLCVCGAKRTGFANRFRAYRHILGSRTYCTVKELMAQTGESDAQVVRDLRKMIGKGMFREGHLDDQTTTLMVTDGTYQQYQQSVQARTERERQEQLIRTVGPDENATPLTSEAIAMLQRGQAYLAKIRTSNEEIPDPIVSQKLEQTELILQNIFERAQEHPEVIPDLEQLMNYYLPVTVKLLDAYEELDKQSIQSENIQTSKQEIAETLDTLNTAFEKLLDSIFKDTTWDVSTDITVLHTVLAQEGLVDDPFDRS